MELSPRRDRVSERGIELILCMFCKNVGGREEGGKGRRNCDVRETEGGVGNGQEKDRQHCPAILEGEKK